MAKLKDEAARHDVAIDTSAKTPQPVRIQPLPLLLTPVQCRVLRGLGLRLRRLLNHLLRTYLTDETLQEVLPLGEDERAWMARVAPHGFPEPATVIERFDTNLMVEDPAWLGRLKILELNAVGVGCLHFMPVANQLMAQELLPLFQEALAPQGCQMSADPRILLRRTLEAHAKAIGRPHVVVAFVERREPSTGGADEMRAVSQFLQSQGLETVYADPRELEVRKGEIAYRDTTIDLLYRDFSLSEVLSIERHGGSIEAVQHAFAHNQVVSALTGEFDHKSLCELLSAPEFARSFTPSQRRLAQAVIPWTRLLRERKTTDPDGHEVDLPAMARTNRQRLVLKPNRSYGGQDVLIGVEATQASWEEAIARALTPPNTWVVQELVPIPQVAFPDPDDLQAVREEFATVGFLATPDGIAFVGRSSTGRIVNIARGGSLVPVFLIRVAKPPGG